MPKTLNIAVIGAGTMAQAVHLPVLRRRWDRFTVTALVEHSPRRRREASEVWGVAEESRYESVADLITAVRGKKVAVDAALLSTDGLHVSDLMQLMRRGIPVLVEPPLGFSAEEIAEVVDFERMTGRHLVMMAHPQQYDDSVIALSEKIAAKDVRMIDHEVLMPASQPLFGWAHVTTSAYDLPTEVRSQRRKSLQAAVEAGAGGGATQRDRDLYVKGLLTGVAHQVAVIERAYGPVTRLVAVRHWPKGVIPGSIEILGELENGAPVRLVWHYLPFAPEYSERIEVLSARKRVDVELPAPSLGDRRSRISLREKSAGAVVTTASTATAGAAEAMWEAFHAFVGRGTRPIMGAEEARAQLLLMREVLAAIVEADGRSLEPEPEPEPEAAAEPEPEAVPEAKSASPRVDGIESEVEVQPASEPGATADPGEGDEPQHAAVGAPDGDAHAPSAPESAPPQDTDDEPAVEPAPVTEPVPITEPVPVVEQSPSPASEQIAEPAPIADPAPVGEPEPVTEPVPVLEAAAEEPGADRPSAQEPSAGGARRSLPTDEVDVWNLDHGHSHPDDDGR
ncbi:Gfo/Idh/MocA family oxidoreductase [Brachybacterium sp. Marseille-Q2903]|uniref:Gfo/Idh/MocA family oxidoreductase n=1 Tax=Brachybacterium epidermidis TaxID=2781983 RepID=A0ABR9W4Z3_9MICO|nr:Gfo/Idh/MocA family oxidoreductase [Brachybacterium epidermidis]MBE9405025.1 Gfo/Idh/MocA family oxidoreductase [Brachybacterium epidermidis]